MIDRLAPYVFSAAAFVWRRLMFRTTFIAITGSAGKSTATACLGSILSAHFPTNWQPGGRNDRTVLARIILSTRFRHRFTVIEVGTRAPGALRRAAWMIAPDVVVMLRVLQIHSNVFPSLPDVVAEKIQLLSRMRRRGTLVLNADDPLVMAMAAGCAARVLSFGVSPGSFVVADEVSSAWPERMSFRATCGSSSERVETNFPGSHLLPSLLAALTTAISCGVPLQQAALALKDIHPVPGRMAPLYLANGACVICDEFNATFPALLSGLQFLGQAQAGRKIVILGDVLDTGLTVRPRFRDIGQRVAKVAGMAVFLGRYGRYAASAAIQAGMSEDAVRTYEDLREASEFLKSELRSGDLVLSSGWSGRHTERAVLALRGDIACWMERCSIILPCEMCPELKLVPFPARESI
jgi:UDP-N-acetylmuramoyl-tripeptide--D-alanyl-D-alanine ligase